MLIEIELHRYQVRLADAAVLFAEKSDRSSDSSASQTRWREDIEIVCGVGRHVLLFELEPGTTASFSYEPVQWLRHGSAGILGDYQPTPPPACMRLQRDGASRIAVWNDNLNFGTEADLYGFVLTLVGPEGVVVGSSDPTVRNEPDPGPGAGGDGV